MSKKQKTPPAVAASALATTQAADQGKQADAATGAAAGVTDAVEPVNAAGTVTVEDADDASKRLPADEGDKFPHLYGSNVQPAVLEFAGHKVDLGTVVAAAFRKSEMSVEAWNTQPEADREKAIADMIAFGHEQAALEAARLAPPDAPAEAATYVVQWHVKAGGKRYAPGDHIPAELVTDAMLVPGGSVAKV